MLQEVTSLPFVLYTCCTHLVLVIHVLYTPCSRRTRVVHTWFLLYTCCSHQLVRNKRRCARNPELMQMMQDPAMLQEVTSLPFVLYTCYTHLVLVLHVLYTPCSCCTRAAHTLFLFYTCCSHQLVRNKRRCARNPELMQMVQDPAMLQEVMILVLIDIASHAQAGRCLS